MTLAVRRVINDRKLQEGVIMQLFLLVMIVDGAMKGQKKDIKILQIYIFSSLIL